MTILKSYTNIVKVLCLNFKSQEIKYYFKYEMNNEKKEYHQSYKR